MCLSKFNSSSGYTLIELLVTMAILGILASVALPTFGDFLGEFRLNRTTNSVLGAFQTARINAIKYSRVLRAKVDLDNEKIQFEECTAMPPAECPDDGEWVNFSEMQTITAQESVDFYAGYNTESGGNTIKSGIVYLDFLPSGTKTFDALVLTTKPNPPSDAPCDYRALYLSSTGEARRVEWKGQGYGAYGSPFDTYKLGEDNAPACAK